MVKIADFIEAPNSGGDYRKVLLVVHVTVSPETIGAARGVVRNWNATRKGSTQYVVDSREIIQAVRETAYAWAAGTTANKYGIHVEHCGYIQTIRQWRDGYSTAELELSAPLFAELGAKYGIPLRRLTVEQIRHAVKTGNPADGGICGHDDITKAFPGETTHSDPGASFPWDRFMGMVEAAAKPAPAPVKRKPTPELTMITANFWRENKHAAQDAKRLAASRAHVIGLNEARGFYAILAAIDDYRLINPDGTGAQDQNPILLRDDVKFLGQGARKMCDAVGPSPERWATWVLYEFAGQKRAHVNTHSNATIENAGKPRVLPRVTQNIHHMHRLEALVKELRAQGYKVTVGGDLNWAWTSSAAWYWAPKRTFKRLGMAVNWEAKNAPLGGSKGNRRIDYLAHDPADLTIAAQCFVRGEHSDHRWPEVTYRIKGA